VQTRTIITFQQLSVRCKNRLKEIDKAVYAIRFTKPYKKNYLIFPQERQGEDDDAEIWVKIFVEFKSPGITTDFLIHAISFIVFIYSIFIF
jgi:hypothetical protein